jgi:hypothetical protein
MGMSLHHWIPQGGRARGLLHGLCAETFSFLGMTVDDVSHAFVTEAGDLWRGGLHDCIQRRISRGNGRYNRAVEEIFANAENCCQAFLQLESLIYEVWRDCIVPKAHVGPVTFPDLVGPFTRKDNLRPTSTYFDDLIEFLCKPGIRPPVIPPPLPVPLPYPIVEPANWYPRPPGCDPKGKSLREPKERIRPTSPRSPGPDDTLGGPRRPTGQPYRPWFEESGGFRPDYIAWGALIIAGTLAADAFSGGASLADDPYTLPLGGRMILYGFGL